MNSHPAPARSSRYLYPALLQNFVLLGITQAILGASLPPIVQSCGWSYTATGRVLAARCAPR